MDYKYIEQLLDRYFECHTSLEEEQILRSFFSQKDVPAHLQRYASLFQFQLLSQRTGLGADFDSRVLAAVEADEAPRKKARVVSLRTQLMPLWKAAAIVAMVFMAGTAAEHALSDPDPQTHIAQPIVSDTYVRTADVASVVAPTEKRNDATAAVMQSDTLTLPVAAGESMME